MYSTIAQFVSALLIFAVLDAIWLGWIAGWWYEMHIGYGEIDPLGLDQYVIWVRWGALAISYTMMAFAVVYLALPYAILNHGGLFGRVDLTHTPQQRAQYCKRRERQEKANFWAGTKVGFIIYSIYNFTNLSFLAEWDIQVALVDSAWVAFAFGVATAAAASVGSAFDCLGTCQHKIVREEIKVIDTEIEENAFIEDEDEINVEEHVVEEVPVQYAPVQYVPQPQPRPQPRPQLQPQYIEEPIYAPQPQYIEEPIYAPQPQPQYIEEPIYAPQQNENVRIQPGSGVTIDEGNGEEITVDDRTGDVNVEEPNGTNIVVNEPQQLQPEYGQNIYQGEYQQPPIDNGYVVGNRGRRSSNKPKRNMRYVQNRLPVNTVKRRRYPKPITNKGRSFVRRVVSRKARA